MIRNYALAALAVATIVATPAMAAVELVSNGGFESTTTSSPTGNFQVGGTGSAGTVTDWTISSTGTTGNNPYNILFQSSNATTGNAAGRFSGSNLEMLRGLPTNTSATQGNFMALDGDGGIGPNFYDNVQGILSQTLNGLVIGNTYDLVFQFATGQLQSRSGETSNTLNVQIGNLNTTYGPTVNPIGSPNSTPWVTTTVQFQATGTSQLLSFLASGSPSGLPPMVLLDNVSVKQAVPEPGTWAMMLIGFGAVGASLRRRRRTTLVAAI